MTPGFQIDNLANHPHNLALLSSWYHQAFSHLTGELTLEQRRQNLFQHLKDTPLPTSFIALDANQQLLGGACLVQHDIETHMSYTPWLSRIIVHQQARGQSVARRLIDHATTYIQSIGYEKLYLLTEHKQTFFSRLDFEQIDKANLNGFPLSIMKLKLK